MPGEGHRVDPLLEAEGVSIQFGGVQALEDVSLAVAPGRIHAIIGPNGAGKTSLLNCISGLYRPDRGRIFFQGEDITGVPSHRRATLGLGRAFQNIELFGHMTVLENLMLGRHCRMETGILADGFYWGRAKRQEVRHREAVEDIIDFLEIEQIRKEPVGTLSYGLQKRVELGRALATDPEVLLLDEPMAGMNFEEKEDMARFIIDANEERDMTIVLIEHDMGVVMDISDQVAVLDFGRKIADGRPAAVQEDERVIDAYLGDGAGEPAV